MMWFLLIPLLADTSGRPTPKGAFPEFPSWSPVCVRQGSPDDLLACARAWSEALGYGGFVGLLEGDPG